MNEETLERALGLDIAPKTPAQLEAIAQAMTEITDELDGLSSRLALTARALTGTVAALRRSAQLTENDRRAGLSTRERLQDRDTCPACECILCDHCKVETDGQILCRSCAQLAAIARERIQEDVASEDDREGCHGTPRASDVMLIRGVEDPGDEYCLDCGEYLEEPEEAWLCAKCQATARDQARHEAESDRGTEGASKEQGAKRSSDRASGAASGAPAPLDDDRGRS